MAGRGRPKKAKTKVEQPKVETKIEHTEVKVEQPKPEINIDELVAQKVAEILAKQKVEEMLKSSSEDKVKPTAETQKPARLKPSQAIRRRKFVPDTTIVRLEQSIEGKFIIADTRGSNYFIEMNGYSDSTTMSFKDLKNYHGKHHSFLNRGKLKIMDVIDEDGGVEFEDVIQDLNLQGVYNDETKISPLDIEYYLLEEESLTEFSTKVRNSKEILETIIEVSTIFYAKGEFNDNNKMDVIRQVSGNYELFKSKSMPSNVHKVSPEHDVLI